jgi:hypothetical protein
MTCWPVSARVGNVKNNDPSLLVEPIAALDANSPFPHGKKPGFPPGVRFPITYLARPTSSACSPFPVMSKFLCEKDVEEGTRLPRRRCR